MTKRLEIVRRVARRPGEVELPPQLENILTADMRRQYHAEKAYAQALQEAQAAQQKFQTAGAELAKANERAGAKVEMALQIMELPSEGFRVEWLADEERVCLTLQSSEGEPAKLVGPDGQPIASQKTEESQPEEPQQGAAESKEGEEVGTG